MAVRSFDLRISIADAKAAKGLSQSTKTALFSKATVESKKPKISGFIQEQKQEEVDTKPTEELSLEEISEGYSEIMAKAEELLKLLSERVGTFVYEFDPAKKPELSSAVSEIFLNENRRISFEMYLQALKLDKDISIAIGEAASGSVNQSL